MKNIYLLLLISLLASCASGKITNVSTDLAAGSVKSGSSFYIAPISADKATYTGDKTGEVSVVNKSKATIKSLFHRKIISNLKKHGFKQAKKSSKADYKIMVDIAHVDHGSSAKRLMLGFGAGASKMVMDVKAFQKTKEPVAEFEVIATSGGRAGFNALGSFLEAHLVDASKKVADYFNSKQ
jgi:hypothetical protein